MLEDAASSASALTVAGRSCAHSCDQAMPPNDSCSPHTRSRARRTTGQMRDHEAQLAAHQPVVPDADGDVRRHVGLALASSTAPPTTFIGHDPSARWVCATHLHARSTSSSRPATSRAIAASTWFHRSAWPPEIHGIAPSCSCTAAMAAPDAVTSAG